MYVCFVFFFFKQKTAYEMRISDWSSDVCSSDLATDPGPPPPATSGQPPPDRGSPPRPSYRRGRDLTAPGPRPARRRAGSSGPPRRSPAAARRPGSSAGRDWPGPARRRPRPSGSGGPSRSRRARSEGQTSELQSLMRISYAVFCLKKKKKPHTDITHKHNKTRDDIANLSKHENTTNRECR